MSISQILSIAISKAKQVLCCGRPFMNGRSFNRGWCVPGRVLDTESLDGVGTSADERSNPFAGGGEGRHQAPASTVGGGWTPVGGVTVTAVIGRSGQKAGCYGDGRCTKVSIDSCRTAL